MQSFDDMDKILVMATITLTTNEINRNLLNEAVLIYVIIYRWCITLKVIILKIESSIDIALIEYLNWPQKKSTYKSSQRR